MFYPKIYYNTIFYIYYSFILFHFIIICDSMKEEKNDFFVFKRTGKFYYEPYLDYNNEYQEITLEKRE